MKTVMKNLHESKLKSKENLKKEKLWVKKLIRFESEKEEFKITFIKR